MFARPYKGPECPHCGTALPGTLPVSGDSECESCHKKFRAVAFRTRPVPQLVFQGMVSGQANVCGNHPANSAESECERCGMFVCALCSTDAESRIYCPACFERLVDEGAFQALRKRVRSHFQMSKRFALFSALAPLGLIFAPLSAMHAVKAWKQMPELGTLNWKSGIFITMAADVLLFVFSGFVMFAIVGT